MQIHPSPARASRRTGSFLLLALMLATLQYSVAAPSALAAPKPKPPKTSSISLVPTITSISIVNGNLLASGTVTAVIKGVTTTVPFTGVPVNIGLHNPQPPGAVCPVLDLSLGPINLNLLGLVVQTSPICLTVTAEPGQLLGDLLCAVGNLLNGGLSLSDILSGLGINDPITGAVILPGLSTTQLSQLTAGLTSLLNQALLQLLNAILTAINPGGSCGILHLVLGPLHLNLLGLVVDLDNCSGGPVTVDITAQTGRGNLLGNLLCELLGGGALSPGLTLGQILDRILSLLNQ